MTHRSSPSEQDRFDELMQQWMRERAPLHAPEHVLHAIHRAAVRTPQRTPGRGWHAVLAGAAAVAVAVAIAIAIGVGLTRPIGQDEASDFPVPSPSTPGPASQPPEASPTASPLPSPSMEPWRRAEVELPAENSSVMHEVVNGPAGYVAVGGGGSVEGLGGVLAWHSVDGESWALTLDAHADQDGSQMLDVVATASGYVGVGYNFPSTPVWISADGVSWREVEDPSAPAGSSHSLNALAGGETGLASIGFTSEDDAQIATAWSSSDGEGWSRLEVPDAYASAWPVDIAITVDGTAVIVGMTQPGQGEPVAWVMGDGLIGAAVTLPSQDPDALVDAVVATPDGFTAVGHGWDPAQSAYRLLVWQSSDGSTWEPIEAEAIGLPLGAAQVEGRGVVAVGATMGLEVSEVSAWQAGEDGTWRTVIVERSNGSGQALLERPDGRLLIVGADDPDGAATVWIEP